MYADRYAKPTRFSPTGLSAAIAINAAFVAALIFAAPTVLQGPPRDRPIDTFNVPDDPPPPPEPKPRESHARAADERIVLPRPEVARPTDPVFTLPDLPPLPSNTDGRIGTDTVTVVDPLPTPAALPPLVAPSIDSRYADALQPPYPPAERRANREGRVTVRVLVGVDGRVKAVEQVDATSDAFWQATRSQALSRWRFKPGTRGSVPVEAWRTMTLRFVLED